MQLSYDCAKDRALMCLRANYESHLRLFCFLYSLTLFNAWALVNAQLASFLKLRSRVLPVTQLHMKIATLIAIYQNITIQPEPPPDPVAP